MMGNVTTVTELISESAFLFAAAGYLAQAGYWVNMITVDNEVVMTTTASQFEIEQMIATVR
jgi:hypothetical protein